MKNIFLFFALILLMASPTRAAETFPARVVGVVDGDTLRVNRKEGGKVKVRLYGIDCPEKAQKYGKEARRLARRLSYGRVVLIESRGKGRLRADHRAVRDGDQ